MTEYVLFTVVTSYAMIGSLFMGLVGHRKLRPTKLALSSLLAGSSMTVLVFGYWLNATALRSLLEQSLPPSAGSLFEGEPSVAEAAEFIGWAYLPQALYDSIFVVGGVGLVLSLVILSDYRLDAWSDARNEKKKAVFAKGPLPEPEGIEPSEGPIIRRPQRGLTTPR